MRKNILLFVFVLVLGLATAPYFGAFYNNIISQYDNSFLGLSKETVIFVAGIPFSYMFLIPFVFELFGSGNRNKLILWLLAPVLLFYLYDSIKLSYIPILTAIIAFALAKLIRLTVSKLRHSNPPMVIK